MTTGLRIGYVLKRFPRYSETFVLAEMLELERRGVGIEIFSLLKPLDEPLHAGLAKLRARVHYLSAAGAESLRIGEARPGGAARRRPLAEVLAERADAAPPVFGGKPADEIVALSVKATSLALLASHMRLHHLHAHFGSDAATVALLAARTSGIPWSFTAHARDIYHRYVDPQRDLAMRRAKLREAAFTVTVSDHNVRHLRALAGPGPRILRLYNGLDLARIRPGGVPRRPHHLLAVGRLVEKKGFRDLVRAAAVLAEAGHEFRIDIVGEGPERPHLEALVQELGLTGRVRLPGPLPNERVLQLLQRATAFVLPCVEGASGDRDGLPTVLLEALATATPAITTSLPGLDEIVRDGETGLLVPPERPDLLAAAMARLLADPALRERLGAAGRAHAERHFDIERNVGQLLGLFREVQEKRAAVREGGDAHRLLVG